MRRPVLSRLISQTILGFGRTYSLFGARKMRMLTDNTTLPNASGERQGLFYARGLLSQCRLGMANRTTWKA